MAAGKTCPHCDQRTWHDAGSHRECSHCGYIGWSWNQKVNEVGSGTGAKCPNCAKRTLHEIHQTHWQLTVRRCGTCNFTAIEP